jgi:hypothetical protein
MTKAAISRETSNYYENPAVLARMTEFLGGTTLDQATCVYLSRCVNGGLDIPINPPSDLYSFLNAGWDVHRSLWDHASVIAHLDIEYVNFDFPAEPYLDQERAFEIQQPVERSALRILLHYGVVPLHLLTGRGHHFVWRIRRDSSCFETLVQIGCVPQSLQERYARPLASIGLCVEPDLAAAFSGLGMVMEYLGHCIREEAAPRCRVPVQVAEVLAGPVERGREIVSVDLSEYGDPLDVRIIRLPYTRYLKPWEQKELMGSAALAKIPPTFVIPLHAMDVRQGLSVMHNDAKTAELASRTSVRIPDRSEPTERLVAAYLKSPLSKFHDWFYSQEHDPPETWPQTYDLTPVRGLPPCVRYILEHPNDLLLKPSGIEQVARTMLALGWHPRHIAGLIRSKYERDYGWGLQWQGNDPTSRADFYVRLFSGLFAAGRDELIDFNCESTKQKQLCFDLDCSHNLAEFRESLLARRRYERLAYRPFNRLFLPDEHSGLSRDHP